MNYQLAQIQDGAKLAELRAIAMKPSLVAVGRFDEARVRSRFLDAFSAADTTKLMLNDALVGFYVLRQKPDHLFLDHLYVHPDYQGQKLGEQVINRVFELAKEKNLPIRLGALRGSKSNDFYTKNGFIKTHEDEFDIYYEWHQQ